MTAMVYYIKNKFQSGLVLNHQVLKNPVILYPLAFTLSIYFLIFGWQKTSRID
ncbi:uncharacterized protein METZ01_LOCUS354272 [marine metagenome]|uniref:Uncharacterized protein n=1 Tax=marine metagenome TaxID=408172 RepID=A0A382RWX6_9ZZZZ